MKLGAFPISLSMGITAVTLSTLPAQAQYLSVPVTNGHFAITKISPGMSQYTTLPTFLTPAGTITITSVNPSDAYFNNPAFVITGTDTPTAVLIYGLNGSASLNDGRTATFTQASAALRGQARVTGIASWNLVNGRVLGANLPGMFASLDISTPAVFLPIGSTVFFSQGSGAVHIPTRSLSNYTTPQFNIPITGGSFTLIDNPGTDFATLRVNSVLTPLGTANLTVTAPDLHSPDLGTSPNSYQGLANYVNNQTLVLSGKVGGLVNGTVALNDGKIATITNRLLSLDVNAQISSGYSGGEYVINGKLLTVPITIQGSITGGSISVPESAVTLPPSSPTISLPVPQNQQFALGFLPNVTFQEPYELVDQEESSGKVQRRERLKALEDLPEVEISALESSRIHPGLRADR